MVQAAPVPGVDVVYETVFTTLLVNLQGKPISTETGAASATEAASAASTTPAQKAVQPTSAAAEAVSQPTSAGASQPTSTEAAPQPTSTEASTSQQTSAAPQPTTTAEPTTSTATPSTTEISSSSSAAPSSSGSGSGSSPSGTFHGDGTYYNPYVGACGWTNTDDDLIVAISQQRYNKEIVNGNSNNNPLCGKKLRVSYEGKSVDVKIVDSCPGCSENSLDLSPAAFSKIADKDLGRIKIDWEFL